MVPFGSARPCPAPVGSVRFRSSQLRLVPFGSGSGSVRFGSVRLRSATFGSVLWPFSPCIPVEGGALTRRLMSAHRYKLHRVNNSVCAGRAARAAGGGGRWCGPATAVTPTAKSRQPNEDVHRPAHSLRNVNKEFGRASAGYISGVAVLSNCN